MFVYQTSCTISRAAAPHPSRHAHLPSFHPCGRGGSIFGGSTPSLAAVPTTLIELPGEDGDPQAAEPPATSAASAADSEQILASERPFATGTAAVAEWRGRVHAARRRAILVVMAAVRLQSAKIAGARFGQWTASHSTSRESLAQT